MKYLVTRTTVEQFQVEAPDSATAILTHQQGTRLAETSSFQAREQPIPKSAAAPVEAARDHS